MVARWVWITHNISTSAYSLPFLVSHCQRRNSQNRESRRAILARKRLPRTLLPRFPPYHAIHPLPPPHRSLLPRLHKCDLHQFARPNTLDHRHDHLHPLSRDLHLSCFHNRQESRVGVCLGRDTHGCVGCDNRHFWGYFHGG